MKQSKLDPTTVKNLTRCNNAMAGFYKIYHFYPEGFPYENQKENLWAMEEHKLLNWDKINKYIDERCIMQLISTEIVPAYRKLQKLANLKTQ